MNSDKKSREKFYYEFDVGVRPTIAILELSSSRTFGVELFLTNSWTNSGVDKRSYDVIVLWLTDICKARGRVNLIISVQTLDVPVVRYCPVELIVANNGSRVPTSGGEIGGECALTYKEML